jgi:hypothetical protein
VTLAHPVNKLPFITLCYPLRQIPLIRAELQHKLPYRQTPNLDDFYFLKQVELRQRWVPENQHKEDA